jgi:hypothetical protein
MVTSYAAERREDRRRIWCFRSTSYADKARSLGGSRTSLCRDSHGSVHN